VNILFYIPQSGNCEDIESLACAFARSGHRIFLLTQSSRGSVHERFESHGFESRSDDRGGPRSVTRVASHFTSLVSYCWRRRIDVVYAHLEPCNFVAVFAQYFIRARVIITRHHVNEAQLYDFDRSLTYRLTYRLARTVIVVSEKAREHMLNHERIARGKIIHINLGYDFTMFRSPDPDSVASITSNADADIVLLTVSRLTKFKRPDLSLQLVRRLRDANVRAHLIVLGQGDMREELEDLAHSLGISQHVAFMGFVTNVRDYMSASNFLVHPSMIESSSITVKEAGLAGLPVVVCRGIGDFDAVISNGVNGFLVDPDHFVDEAFHVIEMAMREPAKISAIATELKASVHNLFDVRNTAPRYEELFHRPL
jgi:glycosyltransferase involved in cell wall biosynthesis